MTAIERALIYLDAEDEGPRNIQEARRILREAIDQKWIETGGDHWPRLQDDPEWKAAQKRPETGGDALDRETLGKIVRAAWINWVALQPPPYKLSWLTPWEGMAEADKEADRMIGEAVKDALLASQGQGEAVQGQALDIDYAMKVCGLDGTALPGTAQFVVSNYIAGLRLQAARPQPAPGLRGALDTVYVVIAEYEDSCDLVGVYETEELANMARNEEAKELDEDEGAIISVCEETIRRAALAQPEEKQG